MATPEICYNFWCRSHATHVAEIRWKRGRGWDKPRRHPYCDFDTARIAVGISRRPDAQVTITKLELSQSA